jgi:hypothetical protein
MKNLVKSAVVMGSVAGAKKVFEALKEIDAERALAVAGLMRRPAAGTRFISGALLATVGAAVGAGAVLLLTRAGGVKTLKEQIARLRSDKPEEKGEHRRRENDRNVAHGVS